MADPGVPRTSLSPARRVGLLMLVVAVLVGVALLARWWTHPSLFPNHGASMEMEPRPVGSTLHAAVTFPSHSTFHGRQQLVTFSGASAHFGRNTAANAEASFSICTAGRHDPVGAVFGRLDRHCDSLEPLVEGTEMVYPSPGSREYVVVSIRTAEPGSVRLTRVDLDYALGVDGFLRRGVDEVGVDFIVHAQNGS